MRPPCLRLEMSRPWHENGLVVQVPDREQPLFPSNCLPVSPPNIPVRGCTQASRSRRREPHSLGIGFLQQCAPELIVVSRVEEDQAVPEGGQAVIDHDIQPLTVLPELAPRARQVTKRSHVEVWPSGKCLPHGSSL